MICLQHVGGVVADRVEPELHAAHFIGEAVGNVLLIAAGIDLAVLWRAWAMSVCWILFILISIKG